MSDGTTEPQDGGELRLTEASWKQFGPEQRAAFADVGRPITIVGADGLDYTPAQLAEMRGHLAADVVAADPPDEDGVRLIREMRLHGVGLNAEDGPGVHEVTVVPDRDVSKPTVSGGLVLVPAPESEEEPAKWVPPARITQTVHYVSYGSADGRYASTCRAATVAEVGVWMRVSAQEDPEQEGARTVREEFRPDACALVVHNPKGIFWDDCPRREEAETALDGSVFYPGGSWHTSEGCRR